MSLIKKNKFKTFDSSYFIVKSHFEEDSTQNYLVYQQMYRYFRLITNTLNILSWKSKGLSDESFDPLNANVCPLIDYVGNKIRVKFNGNCLKQSNNIPYTHGKVVNVYIVYELKASTSHINDPTLKIVYLVQLL